MAISFFFYTGIQLQAELSEPFVNIKPKSIEELSYFIEYKENFSLWKTLKEYRPFLRPVPMMNQHYSNKRIDKEVKHLIIR